MGPKLLHIFRNTPLGRETLLQALHFCKRTGATPCVYVPGHKSFLMHFDHSVIQVDLDASYLIGPETARERVQRLFEENGVQGEFLEPDHFSASILPALPVDFDFMSCPRVISNLKKRIGPGYIGSKVRGIITAAHFPVLIFGPLYQPWSSLAVFFGGSAIGVRALKLALRLGDPRNWPIDIYTQVEKKEKDFYREVVENEGLSDQVEEKVRNWIFFEEGSFEENLFDLPADALVMGGAYGQGTIRDVVFGSTIEKIQANVPNNLMIVGPNCP